MKIEIDESEPLSCLTKILNSNDKFKLIWPLISPYCGGGNIEMVEGSDDSFKRFLDMSCGIDAFQVSQNKSIKGIAHRSQECWVEPFNTWTIRELTKNKSQQTEWKKLIDADSESIKPYLHVQSYFNKKTKDFICAAGIRSSQLIEVMRNNQDLFKRHTNDEDGTVFRSLSWDTARQNGIEFTWINGDGDLV
jgi:hypothetical protein